MKRLPVLSLFLLLAAGCREPDVNIRVETPPSSEAAPDSIPPDLEVPGRPRRDGSPERPAADSARPEPPATPPPGPPPSSAVVDLEAGTIGGIDLDAPSAQVAAQLGAGRVRTVQDRVEGELRTVYVFRIGGADVQKNATRVSYTSPLLRTQDGLGVNSRLSDFDAKYGVQPITPGEELLCNGVTYRAGARAVRACVARACAARTCPLTEVQFEATTGEGPPPDDGTSSVPTVEDALGTVRQYYAFIRAGQYREAYALWHNDGQASGQSYTAFARGFEGTREVSVRTGPAGREEGAAGQRYITVPVTVSATTKAGQAQTFTGTYTLRRSVVDGATAEQLRWRLYRADLRAAR